MLLVAVVDRLVLLLHRLDPVVNFPICDLAGRLKVLQARFQNVHLVLRVLQLGRAFVAQGAKPIDDLVVARPADGLLIGVTGRLGAHAHFLLPLVELLVELLDVRVGQPMILPFWSAFSSAAAFAASAVCLSLAACKAALVFSKACLL